MSLILESMIGRTPLLELPHPNARILAKWEGCNPAGSVKDRVALAMLADAKSRGLLAPGGTVIEATSGNTGIALAALSAAWGYNCCIVMPENMSRERMQLMTVYGAQLVLTPAEQGMGGAVRLARQMAREQPGSFLTDQFANPANPAAHFASTGPEIWLDSGGSVDIFVAGVGTGGTVSGVGRYLKQKKPGVRVFAVEPAAGNLIPGLGAGFVPQNLDLSVVDQRIAVSAADAEAAAKELARRHGLLAGISSGAAIHAACFLADQPENQGKTIVTLLPDTGSRYLSVLEIGIEKKRVI